MKELYGLVLNRHSGYMELSWRLMGTFCFFLQLFIAVTAQSVIVTPPDLLVLNDTKIALTCQSHLDKSSSIRWFMNGSMLLSESRYPEFYHNPDLDNNIYKIEFNATVTASLNLNNTNFSCVIDNDLHGVFTSNDVLLVILTETHITENPWLIEHQTYFQLMWSPIYLWRGDYIDHFIITVIDLNNGSVVNKRVNVNKNLRDRYIESYNHSINRTCSEILFDIRAVNYDGVLNGRFQVRGVSRSDANEFAMFIPSLSSMVLFHANATPILMTQVELPPVCTFEDVAIEYTITANDSTTPMYKEMFNYSGPSVANHMIDHADLKVNQEYSLRVEVLVNVDELKLENFQSFNTVTYFQIGASAADRNQIGYLLLLTVFLISLLNELVT